MESGLAGVKYAVTEEGVVAKMTKYLCDVAEFLMTQFCSIGYKEAGTCISVDDKVFPIQPSMQMYT